ncbi:MAG: Na/Pi cotransporter family protein [Alicyclobacillaceae bacterium]|nr:Na/Pi cotransporter family protein [Alicyclobacillaceae bacterium]
MRQGLEGMAAGPLQAVVARFVLTPGRGIATGVAATALVQSSAAVTAICVGMVAGGSMTFRQALGVVLGANVGSTATPQLLSLDLTVAALPCLAAGCACYLSGRPRLRHPGMALTGFAALFLALRCLTLSLAPLAHAPWFAHSLQQAAATPLRAAFAGCFASALVQSSTATTAFAMALASQGLVPVAGAIAIVLGANVGTCLTSVIAALGQPRAAGQVALAHVLLNVAGVALVLPVIGPFSHAMAWLSPNPAQQVANAHTVFNLVSTLAVWPWIRPYARLIERLWPAA